MTSLLLGIRDGGETAKTTSSVVAITVGVLAPMIILLVAVIIILYMAIMLRKKQVKVCHFCFLLSHAQVAVSLLVGCVR